MEQEPTQQPTERTPEVDALIVQPADGEDAAAATREQQPPQDAPAPPAQTGLSGRGFFVRRVRAAGQFEVFFVSAIGTILIVRAALAITGWPQLGGGKIHFAHLLWGGLGMLIGMILFMALQGHLWDLLATLACGIGFGLFIDELGKFITSDNDYFFQPTMAIIYLVFVGLFFLFRWLGSIRFVTPQAALVNAFDFAKEAVLRDMDEGERDEALYLLSRSEPDDPLVISLTRMLRSMPALAPATPPRLQRAKERVFRSYTWLLRHRWFKVVVVGWFMIGALAGLAAFLVGLFTDTTVSFAEAGAAITSAACGVLVVIGVIRFRHSHLTAYRWFERAVLVNIFVGGFFAFYIQQLGALYDLVFLIVTYITIRYIIGQEMKKEAGDLAARSTGGNDGSPQMFGASGQ